MVCRQQTNTVLDSLTLQVADLSGMSASEVAPSSSGDMVFENAVLFNRDALIMREFNDAIKAGDSGRIKLSLKMLVFYYRGSGRTKYAYETLHVIHNLEHLWPKPLR